MKVNNVIEEIEKIRKAWNDVEMKDIRESLERFENELTLSEIESYLKTQPNADLSGLKGLLANRWEQIRETNMCYTSMPCNEVNKLCINIAKSIKDLEKSSSFYQLLMPSLQVLVSIQDTQIDDLKLGEFILSDNGVTFIPLAECFRDASVSDHGKLRHLMMINNNFDMLLSAHEFQRVSNYSTQAKACFAALALLNNSRIHGRDLASELTRLMYALRGGGARGSGQEMNAGDAANLGIVAFKEYWDSLPETVQTSYYQQTQHMQSNLENCLGRLFRPNDSNYRSVSYCVELIANRLEDLIPLYQTNSKSLSDLKKGFEDKMRLLNPTHQQQQLCQNLFSIPPKHILSHIFKLSDADQKKIFKGRYKNALIYMLNEHPHELIAFDLDEELKEMVKSIPINSNNDTALMIALQKGASNAVQVLLDWDAPLHPRNHSGKNAIDIALENKSVSLQSIFIKIADLPIDKQLDCMKRIEDGKYSNALMLAAQYHPEAVAPILEIISSITDENQRTEILKQTTTYGMNALMLAAGYRPDSVAPILEIISSITDENQRTEILKQTTTNGMNALMLAARYHPEAVSPILDFAKHSSSTLHEMLSTARKKLSHKEMSLLKGCFCSIPFSSNQESDQNEESGKIFELFDTHLKTMKAELFRMCCHGTHYNSAVDAAHTLIKELEDARNEFIRSSDNNKQKLLDACEDAINKALPTLQTHRNFLDVFINFVCALLACVTLVPIPFVINNRWFYFWKTSSKQNLDEFKQNISKTFGG